MKAKTRLLINKQKKELKKVGKYVIINNIRVLVIPIGITVINRQFPTKDKLQTRIRISVLEQLEEAEFYHRHKRKYNTLDPFLR